MLSSRTVSRPLKYHIPSLFMPCAPLVFFCAVCCVVLFVAVHMPSILSMLSMRQRVVGAHMVFLLPLSSPPLCCCVPPIHTRTPKGNVFMMDVRTVSVRQRILGAHLVFVTALDFSPNSRCIGAPLDTSC
ncbi:unnamed protein product, partial [Closterium sp. Naga37s-1]